jgi:hypothetical protein
MCLDMCNKSLVFAVWVRMTLTSVVWQRSNGLILLAIELAVDNRSVMKCVSYLTERS